jgi:hypothetical protein
MVKKRHRDDAAARSDSGPGDDVGRRSWIRLAGLLVVVNLGLAVLITAFVWPTVSSAPKDVPIAVAPSAAATQVSAMLAGHGPAGAVEVVPVTDHAAAEQAIRSRDVYGAIVVGPSGPVVLKASAASGAVGQLLDQLAAAMSAQAQGVPLGAAVDVVPSPTGDPHGAGFAISTIPLTIAGLVLGAAIAFSVPRRGIRLVGLIVGAVVAGVVVAWLLHILGVLDGSYPVEALAIAATIGSVAAVTVGAVAVGGRPGIAPVAAVMVLLGVPLSGAMSAPEFLPTFWGGLGQWLPPGAGANLVRTVAFFPDASAAGSAWILVGWLLVGVAAVALSRLRRGALGGGAGPASSPADARRGVVPGADVVGVKGDVSPTGAAAL